MDTFALNRGTAIIQVLNSTASSLVWLFNFNNIPLWKDRWCIGQMIHHFWYLIKWL